VLNQCRDMVRAVVALEEVLSTPECRRLIDLTCAFGLALEAQVRPVEKGRWKDDGEPPAI
jgi:predicted membrane chloride channel (bestrophin family)